MTGYGAVSSTSARKRLMEATLTSSAQPTPSWRHSAISQQRGRAVAALMLILYFALVFGLGGYWQWHRLGVPITKHGPRLVFNDFRDLTSAWDCARRGI